MFREGSFILWGIIRDKFRGKKIGIKKLFVCTGYVICQCGFVCTFKKIFLIQKLLLLEHILYATLNFSKNNHTGTFSTTKWRVFF